MMQNRAFDAVISVVSSGHISCFVGSSQLFGQSALWFCGIHPAFFAFGLSGLQVHMAVIL